MRFLVITRDRKFSVLWTSVYETVGGFPLPVRACTRRGVLTNPE
ncbi:uncharacterized [Tachysurus ichikawai]